MCWRKVTVTGSLDTGADQLVLDSSTRSASGSENEPLLRWPGSLTVSDASPAVEMTFAEVLAVYSRSTPGTNAPNEAGAPRVSARGAGTVPPTGARTVGNSSTSMCALGRASLITAPANGPS